MENPDLIQNEVNRLKNLINYKEYTDEQLINIAKVNLKLKEFKNNPLFDDVEEQKYAEEKYKLYLEKGELESPSEIDTLRSLVYTEIFEVRIQKELNKLHKEEKYPPEKLTSQLVDIQNQKMELKVKLGIDSGDGKVDDLTGYQMLLKRGEKYIEQHRNEFTICAPDGTLLLLRRRVKDFEAIKHPWFAGRWLFNLPLFLLVKEGRISNEEAWKILCGASLGEKTKPSAFSQEYCTDYINYCLEHWDEITSYLEKSN